jgi:hypothetical protein
MAASRGSLGHTARELRVEYPWAFCYARNRGDRREAIVADDADRLRFLETLTEACAKTDAAAIDQRATLIGRRK